MIFLPLLQSVTKSVIAMKRKVIDIFNNYGLVVRNIFLTHTHTMQVYPILKK